MTPFANPNPVPRPESSAEQWTMNAKSQTFPQVPARMGAAPASAEQAYRGGRGSPRTSPPIEQRFTGPIRPHTGTPSSNPFGPLPGLARVSRQRTKSSWAWVTSPTNMVLTMVLVAASVAVYVSYLLGHGATFKINLVWPA